jgi:hypothetical protein
VARRPPKRRPPRKRARSNQSPATKAHGGSLAWLRPVKLGAWGIITVALLAVIASAMEHQVTWYLAVDQFGYVTFAHDLLHGHLFHDWPPAHAIAHLLRPRTDMLAQTYVWDHGIMYSRYAPGFPMLLAGWLLLFGDSLAHYLNPTLYIGMLCLAIAFQWELTRSLWRGTLVAILIFLCPTYIHLWGLTLTRDMSTHLFGLGGLALLLSRFRPLSPRRVLAAGLCIGFAGTIRPDAVMYVVPASILATWRWARGDRGWGALGRRAAWGAAGVLLGLLPSMIFYGIATGNPFVPTQAMELRDLLSRLTPPVVSTAVAAPAPAPPPAPAPAAAAKPRIGYPSGGWQGGTLTQVQGGGLRFSHLRDTLRGNWGKIRYGYGRVLVAVAVWGAVVGLIIRPMFAVAGLTYVTMALLFFSMWTRPDSRYLIGVWVLIPMFVVEGFAGTLDLVRWLWRRQLHEVARGLALAFAVALLATYAFVGPLPGDWRPGSPMPTLTVALVAWGVLAGITAAIWPGRRTSAILVPALMLTAAALAAIQAQTLLGRRASFQRPQAERARLVFRQAVDPHGVVITSEAVGRPMENIEYYADRRAVYLTALKRWRIPVSKAAQNFYLNEQQPYLLLQRRTVQKLMPELRKSGFQPTLVADIPPARNYDFFVAAPFHRGLPMQLWRLDWPFGKLVVDALRQKREAEESARGDGS